MPTVVWDDRELVREVARDLGGGWVYTAGRTFECRDAIWHHVSDKAFELRMLDYSGHYLNPPKSEGGEPTRKKIDIGKAKQVAAMVQGVIERPDKHFETGPVGVAFGPHFVRHDGRVDELKPEHRCRHKLPFDYDEDAICSRFIGFLEELFDGDDDASAKIRFLQEYIGACLFGVATRYDKMVVLFGSGANGKSVLIHLIQQLFPLSAVSAVPPQRWSEEYYLAALEGKMLNVCAELPERQILASEELKAVIAGDEQTARHPRGEPFKFLPRAGHLFAANNLPRMNDFSRGLWRRLEVLGFNRSFEGSGITRQELVEGMAEELQGIAAWAAEGCFRLVHNREYTPVPSSLKLKNEWRLDSNPVEQWLRERTEPGDLEDRWEKAVTLYEDFCRWADREGFRKMNSTTFGNRLRELGVAHKRMSHGRVRALKLKAWMSVDRELPEEDMPDFFDEDPV